MAQSPARVTPRGAAYQEIGVVSSVDPLRVDTEHGERAARLAASCLLAPEIGDLVLSAVPTRGALYVLAVLERRGEGPVRLRVEGGDVALEVPDGRLSVASPEGIDLMTSGALVAASKALEVTAEEGRLRFSRVLARAREIAVSGGVLEGVFDVVETAADRLTQRLGRAYRFVEGADLTRAGSVDLRAEDTLVVRARDALVNARRLVRLDGEQIHVG